MSQEVTWEDRAGEAGNEAAWALFVRMPTANPGDIARHVLDAIRPIVKEEIAKAAHTHVTSDEGTSYCPLAEDAMRRAEHAVASASALAKEIERFIPWPAVKPILARWRQTQKAP